MSAQAGGPGFPHERLVGHKTVADHQRLFVARLRRADENPGAFGARRDKQNRRSILDFLRDVRRMPLGLSNAQANAALNVAVDEFLSTPPNA